MRDYKIEISNGSDMEFYLHDDDKLEGMSMVGTPSISYVKTALEQVHNLMRMMKIYGIQKIEITKQ